MIGVDPALERGVDPRELFETWAPRGVIWSEWAKPILFVEIGRKKELRVRVAGRFGAIAAVPPSGPPPQASPSAMGPEVSNQSSASRTPPQMDLPTPRPPAADVGVETGSASGMETGLGAGSGVWAPPWSAQEVAERLAPRPRDRVALVVDVPAVRAIELGLALAKVGYRPVPLFNTTFGPQSILDVGPIAKALLDGAESLGRLRLDPDAPPAFLIDAHRASAQPKPGDYDNRWIVFPQDFPAASLIKAHGFEEVQVLREDDRPPENDLLAVLDGWRREGVRVGVRRIGGEAAQTGSQPAPLPGPIRRHVGPLLAFAAVFLGLRRSSAGGFGAVVPHAGGGGGMG